MSLNISSIAGLYIEYNISHHNTGFVYLRNSIGTLVTESVSQSLWPSVKFMCADLIFRFLSVLRKQYVRPVGQGLEENVTNIFIKECNGEMRHAREFCKNQKVSNFKSTSTPSFIN